jgi:Holliday junction resolvasome RuvABC endonuclease subunit
MTDHENTMLLTLDLASRVGFAFGRCGDAKPKSGSILFGNKDTPRPRRYRRYREWLVDMVNTVGADIVTYERPFAGQNIQTARFLFGLSEHTDEIFDQTHVQVFEASVSQVRMHFIGSNPKGDEGKRRVQAKCNDLGWEFEDSDAADAMAVWSYQRSILVPRHAVAALPMFRGVEGSKPRASR